MPSAIQTKLTFLRLDRGQVDVGIIVSVWHVSDDPQTILDDLQSAVTKWVKETEDGQKLYEYSCQDLNIGDLAHDLEIAYESPEGASLRPYLDAVGFERITCEDVIESTHVDYDTRLVKLDELED